MTWFGQVSTHVPQRTHSVSSIESLATMAVTSMLIGHSDVHVPHRVHFAESETSRSDGHVSVLRTARPVIMNGAIQHTE